MSHNEKSSLKVSHNSLLSLLLLKFVLDVSLSKHCRCFLICLVYDVAPLPLTVQQCVRQREYYSLGGFPKMDLHPAPHFKDMGLWWEGDKGLLCGHVRNTDKEVKTIKILTFSTAATCCIRTRSQLQVQIAHSVNKCGLNAQSSKKS